MTYSIKIKATPDSPSNIFWGHYNAQEYQEVAKLCVSTRRIGIFESWVITWRTDTLKNFCKDFFFPNLINSALKTHDLAKMILFVVVFGLCDIITFPIRVFTIIPRYLYNASHPKEAHPFYRYLINQKVNADKLNADYIFLELKWTERKLVWTERDDGELVRRYGTVFKEDYKRLDFIQLHAWENNTPRWQTEGTKAGSYLKVL